jgi:muconolactone delta-isomerase
MKVAVIVRPKLAPPPDRMPQLGAAMAAWTQKYAPHMETLYFFVAGGGLGILDVEESSDVHRMMAEYPFMAYSDIEVRPVVEPMTALNTMKELAAARAAS